MPWAVPQFFDASGNPLNNGKLCVFEAGTSTLKDTFTTAALNIANTNPVVMGSGGWPEQSSAIVGIFLEPGESYKFVLKAANATTCVPDTGTTIWSVDNVTATPVDSGSIDVDGTAGEALSAGDVVYLSDGSGSRTIGRWYKADADLAYASSTAPFIGMAPDSIGSGDAGTIRIKGLVTVSGVSSSVTYYVSTSAGGLTSTAPTLIRNVGVGYTATSILLSPANNGKLPALTSAYVLNAVNIASIVDGRCSLTSGTPVTISDVTAATTLYWALYGGNSIGLYTGSVWAATSLTELSIAVPATTNQMYDVFVDYNDGTPQLALTAWTNDTTRATALTTQNGTYVKTGDTQQRYVCSFRTTGVSGQTEDSFTKRYVWNYYNRVPRVLRRLETTSTWTYTLATFQQANAAAANQVEVVVGVAEVALHVHLSAAASNDGGGVALNVSIGEDSTTTAATGVSGGYINGAAGDPKQLTSVLDKYPAIGWHRYVWLEKSTASGTTTWSGTNQGAQSGLSGWIDG